MKRKLVSMVMCMALGATMLAGCGNSANTSTGNAGASNDAAAKTDDAAAADQTDDSAEAAGTESSAASGDTVTIGFAQVGHESDWRTASTDSCLSVFSADNGYDLQFVDCDNDSAVQLEAVRGFIEQDVDYIIIDPIVSTGWDTVLTECEEAGIPVIVIDRTIDDSDKYVSWVGSNFKTEGLAAGEWLKAYTDAKGISDVNVLVIEGSTGASATIGRTDGFKEIAFCEGIQAAAPVDSYVTPEPWAMPGYDSDVIMAAGAFVQGSSIELSADGPIKPPYAVYFQGGLTWYHAKLGILKSLQKLKERKLVDLDLL